MIKRRVILSVVFLFFIASSEIGAQSIRDVDGNVYKAVRIGEQTWMAENLKTTRFNDGSVIQLVSKNSLWSNLTTPGYCWYDKDIINKNVYGNLYNWYAVNSGKLCPAGWHVPTDEEWTTLTTFLGGINAAGCKLKETGNSHWIDNTFEATNETGFTALPGGYRFDTGVFAASGSSGYWWSATVSNVGLEPAWSHNIVNASCMVSGGWCLKSCGFSVRCLRDN
jgi:uncharacterized protein (TIGR02145 family)